MARLSFTIRKTSLGGSAIQQVHPDHATAGDSDMSLRADDFVYATQPLGPLTLGGGFGEPDSWLEVVAIDYATIRLSWNIGIELDVAINGQTLTELRVVYSDEGTPRSVSDGQTVITFNKTHWLDDYVHVIQEHAVTLQPWAYYSLFGRFTDGVTVWYERLASVSELVPMNHGSHEQLWQRIPVHYRLLDERVATEQDRVYGPLQDFLGLFGFELDKHRTLIQQLWRINDPDFTHEQALNALAHQVGLMVDLTDVPSKLVRNVLANYGFLRERKGTLIGGMAYLNALTEAPVTVVRRNAVVGGVNTQVYRFMLGAQRVNLIETPRFLYGPGAGDQWTWSGGGGEVRLLSSRTFRNSSGADRRITLYETSSVLFKPGIPYYSSMVITAAALPLSLRGSWYDARDTNSTTQSFASRVNPAHTATRGATTSAEASDPQFLAHDGEHYFWTPLVSGTNYAGPNPSTWHTSGLIDVRVDGDIGGPNVGTSRRMVDGGIYLIRPGASGSLQVMIRTSNGTTTETPSVTLTGFDLGTLSLRCQLRVTLDPVTGAVTLYSRSDTAIDSDTGWTQRATGTITISSGYSFAPWGFVVGASGATGLGGRTFRVMLLQDGTLKRDFFPDRDIDTSTNPDAGQTTWTSASGEAWPVTRATSGLRAAVVTRPVWLFDGTDDYIQLPAADTPTFTATTGKHTIIVAFREHATPAGWRRLWSAETAANNGAWLLLAGGSRNAVAYYGDGTLTTDGGNGVTTLGRLCVAALVINDGTIKTYSDEGGLQTGSTLSGVTGAVTFGAPKVGSSAYAAANLIGAEIVLVRSLPGVALTAAELDAIAAEIRSGGDALVAASPATQPVTVDQHNPVLGVSNTDPATLLTPLAGVTTTPTVVDVSSRRVSSSLQPDVEADPLQVYPYLQITVPAGGDITVDYWSLQPFSDGPYFDGDYELGGFINDNTGNIAKDYRWAGSRGQSVSLYTEYLSHKRAAVLKSLDFVMPALFTETGNSRYEFEFNVLPGAAEQLVLAGTWDVVAGRWPAPTVAT